MEQQTRTILNEKGEVIGTITTNDPSAYHPIFEQDPLAETELLTDN